MSNSNVGFLGDLIQKEVRSGAVLSVTTVNIFPPFYNCVSFSFHIRDMEK